jgi:hypothetical protein
VADLVGHLLDSDQPGLIKLVTERSEGNPFYAGELVRSYLEHGSLERLPDTVQATVLARLDLLPPDERRVLQLGSIYGRAFSAAGVAALEAGLAAGAQGLCENLAERDLIRPAGGDLFGFRHILIQEVAYGTLPRSERARLHADSARWIEATNEGREVVVAEILAFHYRQAAVLSSAIDPTSEATEAVRTTAAQWLLKAAEVAVAAGAAPEAIRHLQAALDYVDRGLLPRLHERIGDLTAGDAGIREYRNALQLYEEGAAPADDQLRALAGILLVASRWGASVGDPIPEAEIDALRERGRRLLQQASDPRSIARFLIAEAFYPSWLQAIREPSAELIAESDATARRAIEIATKLDDPELLSSAIDATFSLARVVFDWPGALAAARRRLEFEERLGFYERLDAHSEVAWISYLSGDLSTGERASAGMMTRLLPGQSPFPALHLLAWRTITLMMLGRWDEAVATFYGAIEAWNDAGPHAAGYALQGFIAALDIGRARRDARLVSAASELVMSIVARFPPGHEHQGLVAYVSGGSGFAEVGQVMRPRYATAIIERRLALAGDMRAELPADLLPRILERSVQQKVPLLEAQVRRCLGLAEKDASQLSAAIDIWQRIGALPNLGRARAERGVITNNSAETEAGLAILKTLGDANYADGFRARI